MKVGDAEAVDKAPGEKVEVTADVTVTAMWEDGPTFMSYTLLLSGQIGVNFYVDLSMLTPEEREATTMEFEVGGRTSVDAYDPACTNPSTHKYYGFTCHTNSAQMSETITVADGGDSGATATIGLSALSYAHTVMTSAQFDGENRAMTDCAMASLYYYYSATRDYVE